MTIRQILWERLRGPFVSWGGLDEHPATFREELNDQCGRILFFVALISTFAWLPYIPIDRQLHPGEPLIVLFRAGLTMAGLAVLILQCFKRFDRYNLVLLIAVAAYLEIATGVITGLAGADPAYLGGYLFVLALMALIPIPRLAAWSILALSLFLFFAVGFAGGMRFDTLELRYSLNNLLVTILVVAFFVYLLDRLRFSSWEKSRRIREQNETLRESEEFSTKLIAAIPDIVIRTDIHGEILFVNEQGLELTGYAKEDIVGKNMFSFISPDDLEAATGNTILMMEQPLGPREYHLNLGGDRKTLYEVNGSVLKKEDGEPYGMVYIVRDVSTRRQAEEALRESERRLADIIDFLPIATMVIDGEGRVTAWNRAMEAVTGTARGEILGKGDHEYAIPFYGEKRPILIDLVFVPEEELETRYSHIQKKGNVLSAEAFIPKLGENGIILVGYASALYGSDGSIIGAIESVRDVTDIRRVEAELKEAEEKYRTILETMDSGYYEVDLRGDMLYCNPALRRFLGYEKARIEGVNFRALMDEEEAVRAFRIFNQVYTTGKPSGDFYWRLARPDGTKFYAAASAYPVRNGGGSIVGFRGTVRDITILKEAKDAAEAANRSKSIFLANMSHEIRTPMNAILGFAQVMGRDPDLSPHLREHLDIINSSGEHLLALINGILEMSKIEAGRVTFVPNTFDLHAFLKDMERMFRVRTDAKKLRFLVEPVGEIPRWVITDEGKLRQILINLLGNAVKFTEEGGIALRLGVAARNGDTVKVRFEVEDTGPGIAEDEMEHLFKAFEQTRSGARSGGTGLGLALTRGFIHVMGGVISVTSTVGRGTTFRFEIPVGEGVEEQVKPEEQKRRVLRLKPGQPEVRVLIADDRDTNRKLLSQLLGPAGFVTRSVVNGEEAVHGVREWKPRVVLMDMTMPVMDGYEATRLIKASPDLKNTAIVAVTASAFEEDRQRILAAGADDYLSKPFKDEELFETIGRLAGVDYLYEETEIFDKILPEADDLSEMRRLVALLPAGLANRVRDAVEGADIDLLNELAEETAADQPVLAQRIREMAARYEYDALIELFSPGA